MEMTPNESHEDWLIEQAKSCIRCDPYAAKAWLITARTLFPRNFSVQYESYNIEKSQRSVQGAAKLLEEMFVNFPQESQFWQEVHHVTESLQSDAKDERTVFLKDVFAALPTSLQCHMLLRIVDNTKNVLEQCRLSLLVLQRYPDRIPEHGVKLVDLLMSAEKQGHFPSPVNCYRKYLVCDVLPLILKQSLSEVPHRHLLRWLQKAIEFFVCYITQAPSPDQTPLPSSPDLLSPTTKIAMFSASGRSLLAIPGLSDKEAYVDQPWQKLYEIVRLTGSQLDWDMGILFSTACLESQWKHVNSLHASITHKSGNEASATQKQLLHCTTVLFFESLYNYSVKVDPDQFTGGTTPSGFQPLVLIEGFKMSGSGHGSPLEHKSKKHKADSAVPQIIASSSLNNSSDIIQKFLMALKCWELLHASDFLEKEFTKLCHSWKTDTWVWLRSFEIDVLIYQTKFQEASRKLLSYSSLPAPGFSQLRADLQLASCYYCLENFSKACEMVLNVITGLPQASDSSPHAVENSGGGRQLRLLRCTETEVLPYCIHLMITCIKEKAFGSTKQDDVMLGHMMVLMQYDWPRYEHLFLEVLDHIQRNGSFTYNLFFNYIINIDILEQFAFLKTQEGGKCILDILQTSTKVLAQQRTVTRGVNKGVKEDFKVSMEKQVRRSQENVETVIRQFIHEEKVTIQQFLS